MIPAQKDRPLIDRMQSLKSKMMSDDWLYRRGKRVAGRIVKVKSGLEVVQRVHKAAGGLIRAEFLIEDGHYKNVAVSGDYFCFPKDTVGRLAAAVEGTPLNGIGNVVADFYRSGGFELPGVKVEDWLQVFRV
jgi:hypothetical protein